MKRMPSYVAKRTDTRFDKIGFEEIIVGLLETRSLTLDGIVRRLTKDGIRRKHPFTRKQLLKVLNGLEDMGFIYMMGSVYVVT